MMISFGARNENPSVGGAVRNCKSCNCQGCQSERSEKPGVRAAVNEEGNTRLKSELQGKDNKDQDTGKTIELQG